MGKYTKAQQKRNRAKWVKALRSGEYDQARNVLTDGKGFCCLGVACEISGLGYWTDHPNIKGGWAYRAGTETRCDILPKAVADWLGINPRSRLSGGDQLSAKNDRGASFTALSDIIESEPPGLLA